MGERMRALDWSATPVGGPEQWPQSLRSTLSMLLPSRAQIILFWGPEFVVFYNDAYRPVFGAKHPQMLGRPGREAWSEIWDGTLHDLLAGVVRTGEAFWARDMRFELDRYGFLEETYFDVSYDPVRVESGDVGGVFCIVTETTERVVGERRLSLLKDLAARNAAARTASDACQLATDTLVTDPADVPFALVSLQDELQSQTPGAERLLAEAAPSLVQRLPIVVSGHEVGQLVAGLNPKRPLDERYRSFLSLVADQLSTAVGNALAHEDERRRVEALAQLDRAKTAFFSNVSHEFRTPLTLLMGPLEDLLADATVAPEVRSQVALAHRNSLRLQRLVNTLLDFSRIEAGRIDSSFAPTNLALLTTELASNFRSAMERAGIEFVVDCPPTDDVVYVDREQWEKVVLNLLSNALKFTLHGRVEVSLRHGDGQARLQVRDTGIGIPPQELPRLFERFHRVKGAQGRSYEGTGIGLALVQELVRLHGGDVTVQSDVGRGTVFTVTIPLGSAHLPADRIGIARSLATTNVHAGAFVEEALRWLPDRGEAEIAGAPRLDGDRPRVLVADDNADMRDYLTRILEGRYRVEAVTNGAEAMESIRTSPPDLVVSDVMMPKLDGFGLLAGIRRDERLRGIPVVLLSARAGEESRIEGLQAGADDYMVKPFSARELLACVSSHMQLARLRREADAERLRLVQEAAALTSTLSDVGAIVVSELDRTKVVQAVTDAATELTSAQFGAFFYNVLNEAGESYTLYTISGVPREAFSKLPMPRNTALFDPTFKGLGIVRSDDITRDPRYGKNPPHHGMPAGHLPVCSYLAVPVKGRSGQVIGGLFFGHPAAAHFTAHHEQLAVGVAAWAAVALENASLYATVQEANRLKDDFLASLSHELRTPLNAIVGYTRMLRTGTVAPDRREKALETLERNAASLTQIVEEVLDVSRIVSGKIRLTTQRVDVAQLVQNALDVMLPTAEAKAVNIQAQVNCAGTHIAGDPDRLQQVLWNLLSNAVKFTDRGGTVAVSVERTDGHAEIVVQDSGIGIAPDFLPHVFERFRQANSGMTREHGGLGLGLSIARHLVEMHGGSIAVASDGPGRGARFTVRIPIIGER
jgi:signal transduction histidine kinase/DNA-binding response OmpR family regulator